MTNIEFIRNAEFDDLADYLYLRLNNHYMSFNICGIYADFEYCENDCINCVKRWMHDEKRDDV